MAYAGMSFAALFPLVNPLSALPVFLNLTRGATTEQRKRMAIQIAIDVLLILVFTQALGRLVLELFDLSLGMLQIAGGLIVANTAWQMSTGASNASAAEAHAIHLPSFLKRTHRHQAAKKKNKKTPTRAPHGTTSHLSDPAGADLSVPAPLPPTPDGNPHRAGTPKKPIPPICFSPMAMPILSGPGAMGIVIGLETQAKSPLDSIGLGIGSLGIAILVAACLLAANPLSRAISPAAMLAMTRIFGFILLAIAVAVMAAGVSSLFGIPLHGSPG